MSLRNLLWVGLLAIVQANVLEADTQVVYPPLTRGVVFPEAIWTETLGQGLAGLGDFNGDGLGDVAFGTAPAYFLDLPSAVYLVWGRREFPQTFDLASEAGVVRISTVTRTFGTDVYAAGDVDGDGLADAYIFQLFLTALEEDPHLYLLYGDPDLPPGFDRADIGRSVRGLVLTGAPLPSRTLANPIASLGDFNGDGLRDLAIGDGNFLGLDNENGLVTLIYSPARIDGDEDIDAIVDAGGGARILASPFSDRREAGFGDAIADAGDVNGDGLTDLVVSDRRYENGLVRGRAYLIYGSRSFPRLVKSDALGSLGVTIEGIEGDGELSGDVQAVFGGGDLDGDGRSDFGLSLFEETGGPHRGRLLIARGGPGIPSSLTFSALTHAPRGFQVQPAAITRQRQFGYLAAMTPDENKDGRSELLVTSDSVPGRAYVIAGPASQEQVDVPLHEFVGSGRPPYHIGTGKRMAAAPDVNGDGTPDYLLSTPDALPQPGEERKNAVFLFYGGYETEVLALTAIQPAALATGESAEVTITGTGFLDGIQAYFGAMPALEVKVQDPHTLIVKAPIAAVPGAVDVRLVLPDAREAKLEGGFTYIEVRSFSAGALAGATAFVAPKLRAFLATEIRPSVLGDISGDGIEDFALRAFEPSDDGGWVALVEGGASWAPVVPADGLDFSARTGRFRNSIGQFPDIFPLGDLDGDGRADYAFNTFDPGRGGEFLVFFAPIPPGTEVEYDTMRDDPAVGVYSSRKGMGNDLQGTGDFDGDAASDLVLQTTNSQPELGPPEILVVRGPFLPGEKLDLDTASEGRVLRFFDSSRTVARHVGTPGDVNGDGLGDLVFNNAWGDRAVYLLLGHLPASSSIDLAGMNGSGVLVRIPHDPGMLEDAYFRAAGDVNGDGFRDILFHNVTPRGQGYAGVLHGRTEFAPEATVEGEVGGTGGFFIFSPQVWGVFAYDAAVRGDLDGDARTDLVTGSPRFQDLEELPATPGELMVFHEVDDLEGNANQADVPRARTVITGTTPRDRFGATVEVLGDQDADGLPELLVEAPFFQFFASAAVRGRAYLIPGSSLFGPEVEPPFIRGDSNADGTVNITDPIGILGTLFLGVARPTCEDRADSNDDGVLNITDGIYLLGHLFQGGPAPPAPYPGAGSDPTADGLPCR